MHSKPNADAARQTFDKLAAESSPGIVGQYCDFLLHNKKWWLTPVIVVLLLFGGLLFFAGTGAAPFIYTLF
jgi:hypothetical protein